MTSGEGHHFPGPSDPTASRGSDRTTIVGRRKRTPADCSSALRRMWSAGGLGGAAGSRVSTVALPARWLERFNPNIACLEGEYQALTGLVLFLVRGLDGEHAIVEAHLHLLRLVAGE